MQSFNLPLLLIWLCLFLCVGCRDGEKISKHEMVAGDGVDLVISNNLKSSGCQFDFSGTKFDNLHEQSVIVTDPNGVVVCLHGIHAEKLLDIFQEKFGKPAWLQRNGDGFTSFQYRKDQCGVVLFVSVHDNGKIKGISPPQTCIGIYTNVPHF